MKPSILSHSKRSLFLLLLCAGFAPGSATPGRAQSPAPSPLAATPTPGVKASSGPAATYDGIEQSRYIATANAAFSAQRKAKFQAFIDARTPYEAAGGIKSAGLTSKAAVTARRDLLSKVRAASDDYLAFLTAQSDIYRAELAKTPLVPSDIDSLVQTYTASPSSQRALQSQQMEKDLLACSDEMLADLDAWSGKWSLNAAGKLSFKKKANTSTYVALEEKYNGIATAMQKLQAEGAPAASPSPSAAAGASPAASPAAAP